jgi:uncharacterized membrane protein
VLLTIPEFIGRLHPVLVHLPVGILVLALIIYVAARKDKTGTYHRIISLILLTGFLSAVLACITGYILSQHDDYDAGMVGWHQWMGIATAVMAGVLYVVQRGRKPMRWQWPLVTGLFLLVSVTGHLGGSLTHGSEYLTQPLMSSGGAASASTRKPIPNVQEAGAYADVIQPLLQAKCYSCHNANKRKGGLRMDEPDWLMKGGKNGVVIVAGKAPESELIKRLLLPRQDDDHMPPKEKPQLSEQEVNLLHWWIASGASFDKKVKELPQPEKIKPLLLALQVADSSAISLPDIPAEPVARASDKAIEQLRKTGAVVLPVAQNSNYLMVNFVTAGNISNKDLELLLPIKQQLAWLKLAGMPVTDSALATIGKCTNLTRLQLDHTQITDAGIPALGSLNNLLYLNLVATKVSAAGIEKLGGLKKLRSLYIYQTGITAPDYARLKKLFPKTVIDTGGYVVPLLETDTMVKRYVPPPE